MKRKIAKFYTGEDVSPAAIRLAIESAFSKFENSSRQKLELDTKKLASFSALTYHQLVGVPPKQVAKEIQLFSKRTRVIQNLIENLNRYGKEAHKKLSLIDSHLKLKTIVFSLEHSGSKSSNQLLRRVVLAGDENLFLLTDEVEAFPLRTSLPTDKPNFTNESFSLVVAFSILSSVVRTIDQKTRARKELSRSALARFAFIVGKEIMSASPIVPLWYRRKRSQSSQSQLSALRLEGKMVQTLKQLKTDSAFAEGFVDFTSYHSGPLGLHKAHIAKWTGISIKRFL